MVTIVRREESGWQRVQTPNIGRVNRAIVTSEIEAWAVGDGPSLHLTRGRWEKIPTAPLLDATAQLFGLAQVGPDIWTAGYVPERRDSRARGTVQRWDGTQWTELPLPTVGGAWGLAGVGGVSPDDVWVVGSVHEEVGVSIVLHWNGLDWQRSGMPLASNVNLRDVVALASNDIWVAGHHKGSGGLPDLPVALHWNGAEWSLVDVGAVPGQISGLITDGAAIWGLGSSASGPDQEPYVVKLTSVRGDPISTQGLSARSGNYTLHGGAVLPGGRLLVVGAASARPSDARPFAAVLG